MFKFALPARSLTALHSYVSPLLAPTHPMIPYGPLDLFGASRLSMVVNWIASGAFDPPPASEIGATYAEKKKLRKKANAAGKKRATLLQELFGMMVVIFGGETFLCMCTGSTPSWLLSPKLAILFCAVPIIGLIITTDTVQTRTPLINLLPSHPSLGLELLLSLPDAIGRALLLTQFSVVPLLHPTPGATSLPPTPSTLLLTPFILAVPFASIIFSGINFFSPSPKFSTPAELQPYGWTAVDAWLPLALPTLFLSLIGPVQGWQWGLGWSEQEALVACIGVTWALFAMRVVYNMGHKQEQWLELLGLNGAKKIKTA